MRTAYHTYHAAGVVEETVVSSCRLPLSFTHLFVSIVNCRDPVSSHQLMKPGLMAVCGLRPERADWADVG